MMFVHHHMDNASSVPLRLLGDRRKPADGERKAVPSLHHGEAYQAKKPLLYLIQGELVDLTGDPLMATVLWQLVFWSQRVPDFELFVAEEKRTAFQERSSFSHGWFGKSTQELLVETMFCVTVPHLRRYLNFLTERGWVQRRTNPQNKWDKTIQYRVSLRKLCVDLQKQGYSLPGFATYGVLPPSEEENSEKSKRSNVTPNINVNFASKEQSSFLKEEPL